jgi:hypothetical protein
MAGGRRPRLWARLGIFDILSYVHGFRNDLSALRGGAILIFRANKIVEPLSHIFHYRTNASAGPHVLGCG